MAPKACQLQTDAHQHEDLIDKNGKQQAKYSHLCLVYSSYDLDTEVLDDFKKENNENGGRPPSRLDEYRSFNHYFQRDFIFLAVF